MDKEKLRCGYIGFLYAIREKEDIRVFDSESSLNCVLITFLQKKKRGIQLLPESFIPTNHIEAYPPYSNGFPENVSFNIDKMICILSLLSEIPARHKDLIDEDGFVPIHGATLRNNIKDYRSYLDYLIQTNVILENHYYIVGEKSMSYAWAEQYMNDRFTSITTSENTDFFIDEPCDSLMNAPYLLHWYNSQKLRIDKEGALLYAWRIKQDKIHDRSRWDKNRDTGRLKNPIIQYHAALHNIFSCDALNYRLHIDSNVHRLHSVLTNMQKNFRNFLTYDNQQLVSIDIKNCQPYLACAILNQEFWNPNSINPFTLYKLHPNIIDRLTLPLLTIMMGKFFSAIQQAELEEFIQIVSSGRMYESIMDTVQEQTGNSICRDDAKTAMFSIIFSSNRGNNNSETSWLRRIYKERFKAVFGLFGIIKRDYHNGEEKPHGRLSCLLQSIESEIVLHRCCKRIWEERGTDVPFFTIHDSIVTTVGNEEYVSSIMYDELKKNVGIYPALSFEYWGEPAHEH